MNRSHALTILRNGVPGEPNMLNAVDEVNDAEWLGVSAAFVAEADAVIEERIAEATAEQARRATLSSPGRGGTVIPWLGPRAHEREDAA